MFGKDITKIDSSIASEAMRGNREDTTFAGLNAGKVRKTPTGFEISEEALKLPPSRDEMSMEG